MRIWLALLMLALPAAATTLDRQFKGKVVALQGNRVTLYYDFDTEDQLEDFENVKPPRLLGVAVSHPRVDAGRLVLQGSAAIRHKTAGITLDARFVARLAQKGNFGAHLTEPGLGPAWRLFNCFDYRIRHDGKLRWSALGGEMPPELTSKSRAKRHSQENALDALPVFVADPEEIGKRLFPGADVEIEVYKRGPLEGCRVGTLHRWGDTSEIGGKMTEVQFGLWVQGGAAEIDELTLTIELSDEYVGRAGLRVALADDDYQRERSLNELAKVIEEAPLSNDAASARRELSRRGEDGWKKLVSLIKKFSRNKAYAAVGVVDALAGGDEPERREILLDLHKRIKKPEVRTPILRGLVRWYPQDAVLIHAGLKPPHGHREQLLRLLIHRGVPDDVVKSLTEDEELAEEAFEILRARKGTLAGASMAQLARIRAAEAYNAQAALDFRKAFAKDPNWELFDELIKLTADKDEHLAQGAYMLLMTISGKEVARDASLWRSWLAAQSDIYKAPDLSSAGVVAAAVLRGRDYLLADLLKDGACVWPTNPDWPGCRIGATALAVTALRVSGVPGDHPAIQKAIRTTLLAKGNALRGDMERYTYALTMLTLALAKVDRAGFRPQLEVLANRICQGQLDNGQWTYRCYEKGYASSEPRAKLGDNSNTQYAILALRAARRAGVDVPKEVWSKCAKFWRESPNRNGGWGYGFGSSKHELSMTAAGIATLSICVEALMGDQAGAHISHSGHVAKGHQRLGELLLTTGYRGVEIYAMYGVERAAVLTGVRAYNDFEWYQEGCRVLVGEQKDNGSWGDPNARGVTTGMGYGEAVDTAYAILFLKLATTVVPGAGEGNVVKVRRVPQR